ncbi:tyrosine-type recombinase/integrase [Thalassobaculum litoreum]|uniref:Site-specific recombinase XerD n=1 Tax=Thalassobaculum litoreum DSM 18839 TaxID=1123362 RepID=A0A8G2BEF7_9PROT|nr:site-specific integrase [Thalassobaculum litoreum]SDF15463.1 Site-specific recombinase XerD [Thalassobaculum litoreum DSM 18839]
MAAKLTVASVNSATAGTARREIRDGGADGLFLVIQPSGAKSWALRYRHRGQPRKLTLGTVPPDAAGSTADPTLGGVLTLTDARALAKIQQAAIARGADPAGERREAKRAANGREAADRDNFVSVAKLFIERYSKPRNRTWMQTARLIGLMPDPNDPAALILAADGPAVTWQRKRVQDITPRDVVDVLDKITARAPILANRTLAALRKLFRWAAHDRLIIPDSPAKGIAPNKETSRDRVLSDVELAEIWSAAGELGPPFAGLVKMLVLTGQRLNEVAGMTWTEIDIDNKLWTIPRTRAKSDREHIVPLSNAAVAVLASLPRIKSTRRFVFTTTGTTAVSGHSRAKHRLDALVDKSRREAAATNEADDMPPWRFHDLRRTMASNMARLGISLQVAEKVLNHTSGSLGGIVAVYNRHAYIEEMRAALDTWGNYVETITSADRGHNIIPLRNTP